MCDDSNNSYVATRSKVYGRVGDDGTLDMHFRLGERALPRGHTWEWRDLPVSVRTEEIRVELPGSEPGSSMRYMRYMSMAEYDHHLYWGMRAASAESAGRKRGKVSEFDAMFTLVADPSDMLPQEKGALFLKGISMQ